jgi:hypothetical protein
MRGCSLNDCHHHTTISRKTTKELRDSERVIVVKDLPVNEKDMLSCSNQSSPFSRRATALRTSEENCPTPSCKSSSASHTQSFLSCSPRIGVSFGSLVICITIIDSGRRGAGGDRKQAFMGGENDTERRSLALACIGALLSSRASACLQRLSMNRQISFLLLTSYFPSHITKRSVSMSKVK